MDRDEIMLMISDLLENPDTERTPEAIADAIRAEIDGIQERANALSGELEEVKGKYQALRSKYIDRFMNPKTENDENEVIEEVEIGENDEEKPMKFDDLFEEVKE